MLPTLVVQGVLGSPVRTVAEAAAANGLEAWQSLQSSVANAAFNLSAMDQLLHVLSISVSEVGSASVHSGSGGPPLRFAESTIVKIAGGFAVHVDHSYAPEQRLEMLFSLPGNTMLDTLIGLLLATCLHDANANALPSPPSRTEVPLLELLLKLRTGSGESAGPSRSSRPIQLTLLMYLRTVFASEGCQALLTLLRRNLATRHLRAFSLLVQFGATSIPAEAARMQLELRALAQVRGFYLTRP